MYNSKERMLNAYRGIFSDYYPAAPEFWSYYPAKLMGVDMIEFQREIPLWKALQFAFNRYGSEGWGTVRVPQINEDAESVEQFNKIDENSYRLITKTKYKGHEFVSSSVFDKKEPRWRERYPVKTAQELNIYLDMILSDKVHFSYDSANEAYNSVGNDYLLEMTVGSTFFDLVVGLMGYQEAVIYFYTEDEKVLEQYRQRHMEHNIDVINKTILHTQYESYHIGCAYSNNSLLSPSMWRRWDKPYIKSVAQELHKHDKLLHIHFHGKCMETVEDFAEIGIDCVCPFERPPGGDIEGMAALREVREKLAGRTTMNGNVHTVETLIKGTPEDVQREVREIKEAFEGSPRLIIGSGDQVCFETPEENIIAMIEEVRRYKNADYNKSDNN